MKPPASRAATVVILVQLPFKAFIDVVNILETSVIQQISSFFGALTAAADEDDGGAALFNITDYAPEYEFSNLGKEIRVDCPIRLVDPRDVDRSLGMADEQKLHGGTDIDQEGARIVLHHLPCLFGAEAVKLVFSHWLIPVIVGVRGYMMVVLNALSISWAV